LIACSLLLLAAGSIPAYAQSTAKFERRSGPYLVQLRVPQDGLFAQEETDVEFHIADASQDDPVQGPPPIVNATIAASVTMPAMPGMPRQRPKTHREGVPGDYGVVLYFPHGGDYHLELTVMPPAGAPFTVAFDLPVADATAARKSKPKPYTLEVTSDPATPKAGEPVTLTILIRSRDTKQPVTDFDVVHERSIHFMVVSRDLTRFAHEHPVLGAEGVFKLTYTFPAAGEYRLFADVAPKNAGSQILMQPFHVSGPETAKAAPTAPATSLTDTASGVIVTLKTDPAKFAVGRMQDVVFSLTDAAAGTPITDTEPYLGAMGHLMLIHQDGDTFVHSHPDETDPQNGHNGSLRFLARFPKAGVYRVWLQFQRHGAVVTTTFTWTVGGKG
jgi:hypothetical protein